MFIPLFTWYQARFRQILIDLTILLPLSSPCWIDTDFALLDWYRFRLVTDSLSSINCFFILHLLRLFTLLRLYVFDCESVVSSIVRYLRLFAIFDCSVINSWFRRRIVFWLFTVLPKISVEDTLFWLLQNSIDIVLEDSLFCYCCWFWSINCCEFRWRSLCKFPLVWFRISASSASLCNDDLFCRFILDLSDYQAGQIIYWPPPPLMVASSSDAAPPTKKIEFSSPHFLGS